MSNTIISLTRDEAGYVAVALVTHAMALEDAAQACGPLSGELAKASKKLMAIAARLVFERKSAEGQEG